MRVTFHEFSMGDVEDVEIYAAQPIYEWQQTPQGKWVMEHAQDLKFYTSADYNSFGYRVAIRGEINEKLATEFFLRWG